MAHRSGSLRPPATEAVEECGHGTGGEPAKDTRCAAGHSQTAFTRIASGLTIPTSGLLVAAIRRSTPGTKESTSYQFLRLIMDITGAKATKLIESRNK
jgi:hypothetical protein